MTPESDRGEAGRPDRLRHQWREWRNWREWRRPVIGAVVLTHLVLLTLLVVFVVNRPGRPSPASAGGPLAHGEIALVAGTPHYWVADEAGVLHWPSDTRALVGRHVRWDRVREVTPEQLQRLPRGEAWLPEPAAFVRAGDGTLYLVKWEAGMRWPVLLRLPPPAALAPFGITRDLVAARTVDQDTWERLHDLRLEAAAIDFTPLSPAGAAPATTRTAAGTAVPAIPDAGTLAFGWRAGTFSGTGAQLFPSDTYPVSITLSRPKPDPYLGVVVGTVSYPSFPCEGPLGLLAMSADRLELTERFHTGLDRCTDQGRVTLERRSDTRVFYVWVLPGGEMSVTGILLRRDG